MEERFCFFEDMQSSFLVQLRRIIMAVNRMGNRRFTEENIPLMLEQLPVFMSIYAFQTVTQQKIADLIHRDKASVNRSLNSLKKLGLIAISINEADNRAHNVTLTDAGFKMATQIIHIKSELDKVILQDLSDKDQQTLTGSLRAIADRLEQ